MCASSRLSLAINEEGQILSVNKDIGGGIPYFKLQDAFRVRPHSFFQVYIYKHFMHYSYFGMCCVYADGSRCVEGGVPQTEFCSTAARLGKSGQ